MFFASPEVVEGSAAKQSAAEASKESTGDGKGAGDTKPEPDANNKLLYGLAALPIPLMLAAKMTEGDMDELVEFSIGNPQYDLNTVTGRFRQFSKTA